MVTCRECGSEQRLVVRATGRAECPVCGAVYMLNFRGKFIATGQGVGGSCTQRKRKVVAPSLQKPLLPPPAPKSQPPRRKKRKVVERKRAPGPRREEREREERTTRKASKPKRRRPASGTDSLDAKFSGLEGLVTGDYGKNHFE